MKKDLYIYAALYIFTIIALVVGTWATTPRKVYYEKAHEPLRDYPYNVHSYNLK